MSTGLDLPYVQIDEGPPPPAQPETWTQKVLQLGCCCGVLIFMIFLTVSAVAALVQATSQNKPC